MAKNIDVITNASAYASNLLEGFPITINMNQAVWDNETRTVMHQNSTSFHITRDELIAIIAELAKTLDELDKGIFIK